MGFVKLIHLGITIAILLYNGWRIAIGYNREYFDPQPIYLLVYGLLYGILCLWLFKGSAYADFLRTYGITRILSGSALLVLAFCIAIVYAGIIGQAVGDADDNPGDRIIFGYALVFGLIEVLTGWWVYRKSQKGLGLPTRKFSEMTFHGKNRFVFAMYLLVLGIVVFLFRDEFVKLFALPIEKSPFKHTWPSYWWPLILISIQLVVLSFYNMTASKKNIEPLIQAGMRGGSITIFFFGVLVLTGLLQPITLILPLVDAISMGLILLRKIIRREAPNH